MLNTINNLAFSNHLALIGLFALPLVFYIIKLLPPAPKKMFFSSFYLIKSMEKVSVTKKNVPIWLLIYRIILITLIILFFSAPYLNIMNKKNTSNTIKNYVIIADIGWSMSKEWDKFKKIVSEISVEAEKKNKKIIFYHSNSKNNMSPKIFTSSKSINQYLKKINPVPWQFEKSNLIEVIKKNNNFINDKTFFIFSKFDNKNYSDQKKSLDFYNNKVKNKVLIDPIESIIFLKNVHTSKENIRLEVIRHALSKPSSKFSIRITSIDNQIIFKKEYELKPNQITFYFNQKFPLDVINQIHKLEIVDQNHAGAKYYFDDYSKKKRIGILSDSFQYKENPLLSSVYYIEKSLNTNNILKIGNLDQLIKFNCSVIIIPDKGNITDKDHSKLSNWLANGGTIIRFSNIRLAKNNTKFLPSNNLFMTIRNVGGVLSMEKKLKINPFTKNSMFHGLEIPEDITFKKQLIFTSNNNNLQILATLTDNTPLISLGKKNQGKIFLFHITANNDWSNLPLSALFSGMLQRIVLLSEKKIINSNANLNLTKEINSFGDLNNTDKILSIRDNSLLKKLTPSKENLPGIYENKELTIALNLSNKIYDEHFKSRLDKNYKIFSKFTIQVIDLKPLLLKIILFMFIIDMLITIILKKNFSFINGLNKHKNLLGLVFFFIFIFNLNNAYTEGLDNDTYLAYIKTPDKKLNAVSKSGLSTIKNLLETRTSVSPKEVIGVNITKDPIYYFPFLYWPLSKDLIILDITTVSKIKKYLTNGGMILFDIIGFSRESFSLESNKFKTIKSFLASIEADNLSPINEGHTLTKSFYLLKKFSGRWDNKNLLIESSNLEEKDGVSSVILGFNDWAGAWALDINKNPLYPIVPGGERQREISYRFGINIVMYALTGNYKSDQIHFKSILNRLNNAR